MQESKPATGKRSRRKQVWIGVGVTALLVGLGAAGFTTVYGVMTSHEAATLTAQLSAVSVSRSLTLS